MKKYDKKDYIGLSIVILSFFIFIILIMKNDTIYASMLDYVSQHYAIPEYFRKLFYSTKDFFPSFAFNLGMGQNIFNFSYYGLFSPIILTSYLFPFISMANFIMITSVLIVLFSCVLFYKWISKYFNSKIIRFISTFIFMTSAPLILHSHRHIMFMNYMPFLLFGLFGIENYINHKKSGLLIVSIILIIMTSFFFSIPALLVLFVYSIFLYLKKETSMNKFIKFTFKEIFIFFIPILITAFFLMPTFKAILNSRFDGTSTQIINYLIPTLNFNNILYSSYSLGLTAILIPSILFSIISKDKRFKFLGMTFILLTFFPIINYILNGFMYLNAKVFIPFIPLGILLIANFLNKFINNEINVKNLLIITFITIILVAISYNKINIILLDICFVACILFLLYKTNKNYLLILLLIPNIITCYLVNKDDTLSNKNILENQYNVEIKTIIQNINNQNYRIQDKTNKMYNSNNVRDINEYKTTMYSSLTNKYYKNFFWNEFKVENPNRNHAIFENTNNVLLNIYVGNKYLVSNTEEDIIGYEKVKKSQNYNLYKNNNVFSIGYSNNNLMSLDEYKKLEFPYNIESLMNYTIIDKPVISNYKTNIEEIEVDQKNYELVLQEEKEFEIKTKNSYKDKILIIKFDMEYSEKCSVGDTYIKIEDITNKLTCRSWKYHNQNYSFEYVISSNEEINNLKIKMSKGKFVISNIKVYTLDYKYVNNIKNNHSDFIINKENTKGNTIEGKINVKNDGVFSISIPYDDGFNIYVDGNKQNYDLVNTSFIGFPIKKGEHTIKIIYNAPWFKEGRIVSLFGIIIYLTAIIIEKRNNLYKKDDI